MYSHTLKGGASVKTYTIRLYINLKGSIEFCGAVFRDLKAIKDPDFEILVLLKCYLIGAKILFSTNVFRKPIYRYEEGVYAGLYLVKLKDSGQAM